MARNSNTSILLSELPAFLRDETAADLVATALDEQAATLLASLDSPDGIPSYASPVIAAGVRAQGNAYSDAAAEVRLTAKTIAALGSNGGGS